MNAWKAARLNSVNYCVSSGGAFFLSVEIGIHTQVVMAMPERHQVLIIEDDRDIHALLKNVLEQNGYATDSAFDGAAGLQKAEANAYDIILLDLMLPIASGEEVLRRLRAASEVPVMVISARGATQTKVELLRLGADDYVAKPFEVEEVVARVEANVRRFGKRPAQQTVICFKDIRLDVEEQTAMVGECPLVLTAKEYQLLRLLVSRPQKIFSKANLFESIWGDEYLGDDGTLKTHISNIRIKLQQLNPEERYIETVWGMGYRMWKA